MLMAPRELTPEERARGIAEHLAATFGVDDLDSNPQGAEFLKRVNAALESVEGGENQPHLDTPHLTDEMMKKAMMAAFPGLPSCMTLAEAERRMRAGLLAALGSAPHLDTSDERTRRVAEHLASTFDVDDLDVNPQGDEFLKRVGDALAAAEGES